MILDLIPLALFDASQFFQWFVENANYMFVFIFMVIESSFIPFPSEVVVPPAAYLACTNTGAGSDMNIFLVVVVATLGALVGAFLNYYLALWIGRPVVYSFAQSRFGHMLMINKEKVEKAEAYFDKHGAVSTFVGRLIPAIRQLISIPAGIAKMNVGQFALFTFLGALVWNSILGALGFWLAKTVSPEMLFEKVEEYNSYLTWIGYGIAAICLVFILWNAFKPKKKESTDDLN
ncbi:MAG: DedA family protein [Muribaculaceae bacterium]|nr:DedA family protein [Muribaculaceae bacterium]